MLSSQNGSTPGVRQNATGGKETRPPAKGTKTANPAPAQRANIEINSANFPPLSNSHPSGEDGPIPTPGYSGSFTKYSFDDIINIVKDIKDTSLPASIKPVGSEARTCIGIVLTEACILIYIVFTEARTCIYIIFTE